MRKKGLPEVMVKAVMSLYEGSRTKVRVGSDLSDEFWVRVGVHQGSVLSPLLFAIVVDVVTEDARQGLMEEVLYADDLVLMCDTMDGLRVKFQKWKDALESKGLKVNLGKTKVMVSGSKGKICRSKEDPCGICGKRVMANSVKCTKYGQWIHGRCTKMKRVTSSLMTQFVCKKCQVTMKGSEELVEELCKEVKTVDEFCYLGDMLNASGGSEVAVTARARFGRLKFRNIERCCLGKSFH